MVVHRLALFDPRRNSPCPLPLPDKSYTLLALDSGFDVVYLPASVVVSYRRYISDEG